MNYKEMSDFEINKAVAENLGVSVDAEQYESLCDRDERIVLCRDKLYLSVGLDYCNNPADAWPIIIDNKISIFPTGLKSDIWRAESYLQDCQRDKNPLRAAMIVYLELNNA